MGKGLAGESSQWRKPGDPLASTEKVESITRGGTESRSQGAHRLKSLRGLQKAWRGAECMGTLSPVHPRVGRRPVEQDQESAAPDINFPPERLVCKNRMVVLVVRNQ